MPWTGDGAGLDSRPAYEPISHRQLGGSVPRQSDRPGRIRRWARRELDDLLGLDHGTASSCDGRHHAGEPCDWWRSCTGMALDVPGREHRGRQLAAAGWRP